MPNAKKETECRNNVEKTNIEKDTINLGKGHYYENQSVEKQPKRTSKIIVFLVHHYYKNQNVEKDEKNIENLNFV
jgi:hypothetical protein